MSVKKKALSAVAGVALVATVSAPTLIATTSLLTLGTTNAEAACYGYGSSVFCTDGSSYSSYGNSWYGYNYNTGTSWGGSSYNGSQYGYSYYSDGGGLNWSYSYTGYSGYGYSYSW